MRKSMSYSAAEWARLGAYTNPVSGTGLAFFPFGIPADRPVTLVYETGYLERRPHWNYPNTFSPFWRLYYNFDQGHRCVFPGKEVELGPNRLVVIPDHHLFHSVGTGAPPHFWVTFRHDQQPAQEQPIPMVLEPAELELGLIRELISMVGRAGSAPDRDRALGLSMALLHVVLSREEIAWEKQARPGQLSRVVQHIEKNLNLPLYNRDLARVAGMSIAHFTREFSRHYGVSPAAFVSQARAHAAGYWLTNSSITLEEIAARTGFPNRHYFSRVFKRVTGESPASFRATHSNAEPRAS